MGRASFRWRLPIFGLNQRRFKRSNISVCTADHELVIGACGNLVSGRTYWLQEPKSSNGQTAVRPDRPDLIASLEIFG
jgi:hypothetical protein